MSPDIFIAATNSTPLIEFKNNGNLLLKGRSFLLDVNVFYQPLIDWLKLLQIPTVRFTVDLDYLNSASSKKILELLKIIDDNSNIKDFCVYWHYETDDEDILEVGKIFEEKLSKVIFYFREFAETTL